MPTVAVTRRIPDAGIDLLKKEKGWTLRISKHDRVLSRTELKKLVKGADGILSLLTDTIDGEIMDAAGAQLKVIANYAVGFNNVDVKAATERGIIVTNTPGALLTDAVAEHTIGLLLALAKRIPESDRFARAEKYKGWAPLLFLGSLLKGKTIGIVGLGRIGQAVAERAAGGMGMNVVYFDPNKNPAFEKKFNAKRKSLHALLKIADAVTVHVPLLPSTKHLISTKQLTMMKSTAYLINTSRGPVVDEKALTRALKKKKIAGAALDVFECEPAIDCDISDDLEMKTLENVILTPHTASAALEAREEMAEMAAKNIIAVLHGKKPVNPAK